MNLPLATAIYDAALNTLVDADVNDSIILANRISDEAMRLLETRKLAAESSPMTPEQKTVLVIHHSADMDGLFSREIARRALGDRADYLGWDYGEPAPVVDGYETIYMIDISIRELMNNPRLVWIDHHKSAIEEFSSYIGGYRIDGVAACRLAWQWFKTIDIVDARPLPSKEDYVDRKVTEPLAVRLAGEYDIWDKRDPRVDVFQRGLYSTELSPAMWAELLDPPFMTMMAPGNRWGGPEVHELEYQLLDRGLIVGQAKDLENASIIKWNGFDLEWEGLKFLAVNATKFNSLLFTAGVRPDHDALLGFHWSPTKKKWKFSLYHAEHRKDLDLSQIAVKYGGGGHRGACGFELRDIPFELGEPL